MPGSEKSLMYPEVQSALEAAAGETVDVEIYRRVGTKRRMHAYIELKAWWEMS